MKLVIAFVLWFVAVNVVFGQKSVGDLRPAHAAALQKYFVENRDRHFLPEHQIDNEDLKFMRETFGKSFHPYYATGDFNGDRLQDFAVIVSRAGSPKFEDPDDPDPRKADHNLSVVVFNGTRLGVYRLAHFQDVEAPLTCFIRVDDGRKKRLYFAVFESDADTITLSPAGKGYVAEPDPIH
jgi:hypothetical protein